MNTSTEITIEKVSVKISINQIASFLQMIKGTSIILHEKYIEKLKKDGETLSGRKSPNNSNFKGSNMDQLEGIVDDTSKFRETYEMFSNRYNKIPKAKIFSHFDIDDEEEEKTALDSKEINLSKLKAPSIIHKNSDRIHSNSNKNIEETKKINNEEGETGSNTFNFFFHGLRIYFINDYGDNFYPVL